MRVFAQREFEDVIDRPRLFSRRPKVYSNLQFVGCTFWNCILSSTLKVSRRSIVRDCVCRDATQYQCQIGPAILERCLLDGLRCPQALNNFLVMGAVFRNVIVQGQIGITVVSRRCSIVKDKRNQPAFDEANRRFYETIDWALDITQAEFRDVSISGVPTKLIRRDPHTQIVVTRDKARQGHWRELDIEDTWIPTALELLAAGDEEDEILIAPKLSRDFERIREALEELRRAGIAEPD